MGDFSNNKSTKDGKHSQCKGCNKIRAAKYHVDNKEQLKAKRKAKYWKDPEKERAEGKLQYQKHKDRKRAQNEQWKKDNPDKYKEGHRNWYLRNREDKLRKNADNEKQRMGDPIYRLTKNLRTRIPNALNGKVKSGSTFKLLGCTINELKFHLEFMFDEHMNWDNYGSYWHVDHIIPCASFDLSNPEEQERCFHYTNLQPLEAKENMRNHCKILTT